MKKLLLLNLTLITAVGSYAMEQDFGSGKEEEYEKQEERKIPTLKELAAKQAVKSTDISGKDFDSLPFEAKELIMQQSTSLRDIMNFITSHTSTQEYIGKELFQKIPSLFFNALLNSEIQFSDFMQWITGLPTDIRQSITTVFADQIHKYMTQDKTHIYLEINGPPEMIHLLGLFQQIPIDFMKFSNQLMPFPSEVRTFTYKETICIFIGQQLQLLLINAFIQNKRPLIADELEQKIHNIVLMIKQYINSYKDEGEASTYFRKLEILLLALPYVTNLEYSSFVWDEEEGIHKEK